MARRIIIAVMALITALLAILAVPLGLITAAQERQAFTDETTAAAAPWPTSPRSASGISAEPGAGPSVSSLARQR